MKEEEESGSSNMEGRKKESMRKTALIVKVLENKVMCVNLTEVQNEVID